jgi:hypothetical protein
VPLALETAAQKKLFQVNADLLGDGKVLFEWSPKGNYLAACGSKVTASWTYISAWQRGWRE